MFPNQHIHLFKHCILLYANIQMRLLFENCLWKFLRTKFHLNQNLIYFDYEFNPKFDFLYFCTNYVKCKSLYFVREQIHKR